MRRVKHDVRINENAPNAHVVDNKKVSSRWQMRMIGFSHKLYMYLVYGYFIDNNYTGTLFACQGIDS